MKQYMVIETFKPWCKEKVYDRFHREGRMPTEGLVYIDSWLEKNGDRCFQLMKTDTPGLFPRWTQHWEDLVIFEIIEIAERR